MARIKFIAQGANSLIGGFAQGDLLTCRDDLAAHLVHEAKVAEYVESPAVAAEPPLPTSTPAGKRHHHRRNASAAT